MKRFSYVGIAIVIGGLTYAVTRTPEVQVAGLVLNETRAAEHSESANFAVQPADSNAADDVVAQPATPSFNSAFTDDSSLPGIADPIRQVTMTAPASGSLLSLLAEEGGSFKRGELLAVVDNRVAEAAVRSAQVAAEGRGAIEVAEVQLRLARSELARFESVPDPRAIAAVDLERARGNVDLAKVELDRANETQQQAEYQLALEKARLESFNIRAPFDGQILRVDVQEGQTLHSGDAVLTIADLSRLRTELFVSVDYLDVIRPGQRCSLRAIEPVDQTFLAKLVTVEPVLNAATGTFRCVFEIDNVQSHFPAGFQVNFDGPVETAGAADFRRN